MEPGHLHGVYRQGASWERDRGAHKLTSQSADNKTSKRKGAQRNILQNIGLVDTEYVDHCDSWYSLLWWTCQNPFIFMEFLESDWTGVFYLTVHKLHRTVIKTWFLITTDVTLNWISNLFGWCHTSIKFSTLNLFQHWFEMMVIIAMQC